MLKLENLAIERAGRRVLSDVSFAIGAGELVVLTGTNGSGKSTLALALLGYPEVKIVAGTVSLDDRVLNELATNERAELGLFLTHQEPPTIPGVSIANALMAMCKAVRPELATTAEFFDELRSNLAKLDLPLSFTDKGLHQDLSGGEKKRVELLSLLMLKPRFAILDELDSGLDTETRALTANLLLELRTAGLGMLVFSHNPEFIELLKPTSTLKMESFGNLHSKG